MEPHQGLNPARRLHAFRERVSRRAATDPEAKWHCCDDWQRSLSNKWNSREFARRHGCRVPDLYWCGRWLHGFPADSLPDHFVIRPVYGTTLQGVYVMAEGVDLFSQLPYTNQQLKRKLRQVRGSFSRVPLDEAILIKDTVAPDLAPPAHLDEMLVGARRLGKAYGSYVRIDFYSTDKGAVFGEFAATPRRGRGFTPYADALFGAAWREAFPGEIPDAPKQGTR